VHLLVTERVHRLAAIQDRWDSLREAKRCFAAEDYEGAMKTGVVCRKVRWIGGKDGREVVDYEINTALIEALNSVEKRAAIETGQEVDRSDIGVRFGLADQAAILNKAFTLDELEAMDAKIEAARKGTQVIEAAALAVEEAPTTTAACLPNSRSFPLRSQDPQRAADPATGRRIRDAHCRVPAP